MQNLFINEPNPEKRLELLKNNCFRSEKAIIEKEINREEMLNIDNNILNLSVVVDAHQKELDAEKAKFKVAEKKIKDEMLPKMVQLSQNIEMKRSGFKKIEDTIFLFDDQEKGVMQAYDSEGNFINSRPLTREEKQTSIFSLTGTNNK